MEPDTSKGWSMGAASTTQELADALKHINRAITSPRENGTLLAASDRLLTLERELAEAQKIALERGAKVIELQYAAMVYMSTCPADRDTTDAFYRATVALEGVLASPQSARDSEPPKVDLSKCPKCGGPADNGHDRCYPPNPYYCTKCNDAPDFDTEPQREGDVPK
jgi:hypothetical protein